MTEAALATAGDADSTPESSGSDLTNETSPVPLSADLRTDTRRVIPSRTDVVVAEASKVVGGRLGEHAAVGRSRHLTPLRVLFLLALCALALGWFGKASCLQQAPATAGDGSTTMRLDWDNQRQFTNLCYSDVIALYGAERLDEGKMPYQTYWFEKNGDGQTIKRYMEYPVITGMYMYGVAQVARAWASISDGGSLPGALDVVLFFDLAALGLALFWLVTIWATALTAGTRIWAAWLAALSPLVITHIFTNFDAIAVAMVALAMLSWARRKPWLAGVFIGLGAAAKLYPLLLLVVLFFLCLRSGKLRHFAAAALAAVVAWVVVNLPIMVAYPSGWLEFFRLNSDRGADADSLLRLVAKASGLNWNVEILNIVSFGLVLAVIAGIAFLALGAPTRPRVAQLMFLLVAGFLLVNKVWSPQYSLWLVPLAVLAIPHTRLLLAWMFIDALIWIPRMSLFIDADRRWLPQEWFTTLVVIRALMVIALCVVVIWQIYHPDEDLVRRDGRGRVLDDPAGGVLDKAPDEFRGRRPEPVAEPQLGRMDGHSVGR